MDVREKLNEFAELRGWDKNKLIGWSEAADFGEWLVKNCSIPAVVGQSEQLFCRDCKYDKAETYHDKMWCRDCRQKDRFTAK